MDAILFSADPNIVQIDDALRHLANHEELYWEVGYAIARDHFEYPMLGFIHIKGSQVEYKVTIKEIVPFSPEHYEAKSFAAKVKPEPWIQEWKDNLNDVRSHTWKNALVITNIEPFSYDTYKFRKHNGQQVKHPPQGYIRVLVPDKMERSAIQLATNKEQPAGRSFADKNRGRQQLLEENVEEFVIQYLDDVEPGLKLYKRQLSTPAGRLDLLCKDREGRFVVLELKRAQGTDKVVGQILRYMGWVKEHYKTENYRGIIIVGNRDQALSYAIKAVSNIQVKEFRLKFIEPEKH